MSSPIPEEAPVTSAVRVAPWFAELEGEGVVEAEGAWTEAVAVIG